MRLTDLLTKHLPGVALPVVTSLARVESERFGWLSVGVAAYAGICLVMPAFLEPLRFRLTITRLPASTQASIVVAREKDRSDLAARALSKGGLSEAKATELLSWIWSLPIPKLRRLLKMTAEE